MTDGTYEGVVVKVGPVETVGQKGFQKRLLVVCPDPDAKYKNMVPFEITGDALKDPVPEEGDRVRVEYKLRGREWEGRFFVNINAVRVEIDGAKQEEATPEPPVEQTEEQEKLPW